MIAAVRTALQRLGTATSSELRAETGLPQWQVEHCLEHLLRRGEIQSAAALAEACRSRGSRPAAACRHCPLESVCAPSPQDPAVRVFTWCESRPR